MPIVAIVAWIVGAVGTFIWGWRGHKKSLGYAVRADLTEATACMLALILCLLIWPLLLGCMVANRVSDKRIKKKSKCWIRDYYRGKL